MEPGERGCECHNTGTNIDGCSITYPYPYTGYNYRKTCHGCDGKGWIPCEKHCQHKCVVCDGKGYVYDDNWTYWWHNTWSSTADDTGNVNITIEGSNGPVYL